MKNLRIWVGVVAVGWGGWGWTAGAAQPKFGPAGQPIAVPLSESSEFFRAKPAPDFWRLIPFYSGQYNGAACSVASLTNVMNAIRGSQKLANDEKLVSQKELLDKVQAAHWKARIDSKIGWRGKRGVSLDDLQEVAKGSLAALGLKGFQVELLRFEAAGAKELALLRGALQENEKSAQDYLVVNFLQSDLTGDSEGVGHISPVGAYDAERDRVLILDTDREWYEPYWVSTQALLKAMATSDRETGKKRGMIWIRKTE
jgi:hypothetical protein